MTETPTYDAAEAREYFAKRLAFTVGPVELKQQIDESENITLIDVREPEDYQKGHIPGALNLPKAQWDTFNGLHEDAINLLYCYSATCHLAATAAVKFSERGFQVKEMEGGFDAWKEHDFPIER